MSRDDKQVIMKAIENLPEPEKSLVIGFAAGVIAKSSNREQEKAGEKSSA